MTTTETLLKVKASINNQIKQNIKHLEENQPKEERFIKQSSILFNIILEIEINSVKPLTFLFNAQKVIIKNRSYYYRYFIIILLYNK